MILRLEEVIELVRRMSTLARYHAAFSDGALVLVNCIVEYLLLLLLLGFRAPNCCCAVLVPREDHILEHRVEEVSVDVARSQMVPLESWAVSAPHLTGVIRHELRQGHDL